MTNILAFNKPPIIKSAVTDVGNLAVERDFRATAPKEIADIFFPVEMVPLESLTGIKDCGFQAVVRKDTNKILKVHGSRYTLIKNEDVFGSVDKILRKTEGLDTDGMRVVDQTAYAGGRTIRSYAIKSIAFLLCSSIPVATGKIFKSKIISSGAKLTLSTKTRYERSAISILL